MKRQQKYRLFPGIRDAEALGVALLGSTHTAVAPPKRRIDRAEYGSKLAAAEGGSFTSRGYIAPVKREVSRYGI